MAHNDIHELEELIDGFNESLASPLTDAVRSIIEQQKALAEIGLAQAIEESLTLTVDNSLEVAGVYPLDLSLCGVPEQAPVPDPPPCPPACVPKKCSPVDWINLPNEDPILNENVCEYWVSVLTSYKDVKTKPITDIESEYVKQGIELILESTGKKITETIVDSLVPHVITDAFVGFRNLSNMKVLIKIPFDIISPLEDKKEKSQDDTQDPSNFPLTVVLTADDLSGTYSMFSIVKRAIGSKYSKQYEKAVVKRELSGLPKDILLKREAERIGSFRKSLIDLLRKQNFKINPINKKNGALEGVEIAFKKEYSGIEYVKANKFGCEPRELGSKISDVIDGGAGWKTFVEKDVTNYQTTLAFVANIPSIYEDVTADNPISIDPFLKKYYFPIIEEDIGEKLTLAQEDIDENFCDVGGLVSSLLTPVLIPGADIAGQALNAPQLFFSEISSNACLTFEGKREQDRKFNIDIEEIEKRTRDVDQRKYLSGDPVFENLLSTLGQVTNLKELYKDILNKVGICGLSSLAFDGLDCLMKGFDIESSMGMLVKSFIKNATDNELEKVFFKFNPNLQQLIRDSVSEITSIPLPWEAGYRPGSYQGAGVKYSADYSSPQDDSGSLDLTSRLLRTTANNPEQFSPTVTGVEDTDGDGLLTLEESRGRELKSFRARTKTTIQEQKDKFKSFTDIPLTKPDGKGDTEPVLDKDGNQIIITSPEGVMPAPGLGPRTFAGPFAHAGSVGSALDNIQDNALDILKDVIIENIEKEIISADFLMSTIDNIPGASLIKDAISDVLDCPLPPFFSPPLDDILKTLELDFCGGHYAITLPVMPKFPTRPFFGDIKTILINAAEAAIEEFVVRSVIVILEKLLSISLNVSCEVLKDAAGILKDIAGGADFRDIVSENLCGDSLNQDALNKSLNDLNKALGAWNVPGVPLPTDEDMGSFMDGTSAILTQQELLDLLDGEPTPSAVSYVRQIVNGIPNLAIALPTDEHIKNLFTGMGKIFDRDSIRDKIANRQFKPVSPSICGSPEHLELFDSVRCDILISKGLTSKECEDQINKLKDRAKCDFDQLADILNENYFNDESLVGESNCPGTGIYPGIDPETKKLTQELFSSNYNVINSTFLRELASGDGLLNMILADSLGVGFRSHNEFYTAVLGAPLSRNFPAWGFYAHKDNGSPVKNVVQNVVFGGKAQGVYPDTIALYLKTQLEGALRVDYKNETNPNLSLDFESWEKGEDFETLSISYNYQEDDDTKININIESNDDILDPPLTFDVKKSYNNDIINKILSLGAESPASPAKKLLTRNQNYVFGKLVSSTWSEYTLNQSSILEEQAQKTDFKYITEKIIEKFALKISKNSKTFIFGYDPSAEAVPVNLSVEDYGGTDKNPPFYLKPPVYQGWMGLYDKIIPEVNGCGEESILNFNTISKQTGKYSEQLRDDPRLEIPEACAIDTERPFDRIMPRAALAGTDGAIMATVKLYVVEFFLKALPAISLFNPKFPEVYDDTLLSYIAEKMKLGMLSTGINFRKKQSKEVYYYTFLEEVVQNFGKKVDLEIIIPTKVQIDAMERINGIQETFRTNSVKKGPFTNYRNNLRDLKISYVRSLEPECLLLLNHYISEQIVETGKDFSTAINPEIENLENWIFGSRMWMKAGSLESDKGPLDVARDPLNKDDATVKKIFSLPLGDNLSSQGYADGYFPFILERYIKVRPKNRTPLISGRGSEKGEFQIYNFNELSDSVIGAGTQALPIDNNYGTWSYGLRISMVMSGESQNKINSNEFFNSISDEDARKLRTLKYVSASGDKKFVVPVATSEIIISGETLQASALAAFDINCMVGELINTPEYKTLFNYCFPLQSLLSLVTIYTAETFLLSIGEEWKPVKGGTFPGKFTNWDKKADFKKTKKNLRKLFEGYYHSRNVAYEDEEQETQEEKTRKAVRVKKQVATSTKIKWWKKRSQVPRPAEECE